VGAGKSAHLTHEFASDRLMPHAVAIFGVNKCEHVALRTELYPPSTTCIKHFRRTIENWERANRNCRAILREARIGKNGNF